MPKDQAPVETQPEAGTPPAPPETPEETKPTAPTMTAPVFRQNRIGDVIRRVELTADGQLPDETAEELIAEHQQFKSTGNVVTVSLVNHPIGSIPNDENFEESVGRHAEALNVMRSDLFFNHDPRTGRYEIVGRFVVVNGIV